jgi:hypothetical protein
VTLSLLPEIHSRWVCTITGRHYTVTGHRPGKTARNGRPIGPTVICRRDDNTVILPVRSFQPGGVLQPEPDDA